MRLWTSRHSSVHLKNRKEIYNNDIPVTDQYSTCVFWGPLKHDSTCKVCGPSLVSWQTNVTKSDSVSGLPPVAEWLSPGYFNPEWCTTDWGNTSPSMFWKCTIINKTQSLNVSRGTGSTVWVYSSVMVGRASVWLVEYGVRCHQSRAALTGRCH